MMVSLIGSARREAPIRGIEPARTFEPPVLDTRALPEKAPERQPSVLSVDAMEQSIATARSIDSASKVSRQIAQSR